MEERQQASSIFSESWLQSMKYRYLNAKNKWLKKASRKSDYFYMFKKNQKKAM